MKNIIFILAFATMICLSMCKKPHEEIIVKPTISQEDSIRQMLQADLDQIFLPGDQVNGVVAALKNGKPWAGSANFSPYLDSTLILNITTISEEGYWREWLTLFGIPKEIGKYWHTDYTPNNKGIKVIYQRIYADGDVTGQLHLPDPYYLHKDYLEVSAVDTVNRVISGRFDVHLTDSIPPISYLFYTFAHFSEGTFSAKY